MKERNVLYQNWKHCSSLEIVSGPESLNCSVETRRRWRSRLLELVCRKFMPVYTASHPIGRPPSVTSMTSTKVFVSKRFVQFDILGNCEELSADLRPCYVAVTRLSYLFTRVMFGVSLAACCVLQINNPVLHRLSYTHMHTAVRGTHHVECGQQRAVRYRKSLFCFCLQRPDPLWGSHRSIFGACRGLFRPGQKARVQKLTPSTSVEV